MKHLAGAAFLLSAFFLSVSYPSAQKITPPDVMKAATAYVIQYSETLQATTAEEEYLQLEVSGGRMRATRKFISDVVFVGAGYGQLVTYRDAYSVDANPLRNLRTTVIYARDEAIDLWVPQTMSVQGDITTPSSGSAMETRVGAYDVHEALEGTAKYSKFKQVPLGYKIR